MSWLADFGGFNDGVVFLPAILMSIYTNKMFNRALFSLLPVKKKSSSASRDAMAEKCYGDNPSAFTLEEADTTLLAEETERIELTETSWFYNLCFSKCLCKR